MQGKSKDPVERILKRKQSHAWDLPIGNQKQSKLIWDVLSTSWHLTHAVEFNYSHLAKQMEERLLDYGFKKEKER